jgi:hypothetical protein
MPSDSVRPFASTVIAEVLRGARIPSEIDRHDSPEAMTIESRAGISLPGARRDGAPAVLIEASAASRASA